MGQSPPDQGNHVMGVGSRKVAILLCGIMSICLAISPALSQERKGTWELGLLSGLNQLGIDGVEFNDMGTITFTDAKSDTSFVFGIRMGYHISNHWQVEAVLDTAVVKFEEPFDDISIDTTTIQINGLYSFRKKTTAGADPYLLAGIGVNKVEFEGARFPVNRPGSRPVVPFLPFDVISGSTDLTETMIVYGIGLRVFGTEKFGFRFELKQKRYDVFLSKSVDHEFTFGLMWSLGGPAAFEEEEEIPLDLE